MSAEFKTTIAIGRQGSQTYDQAMICTCIDALTRGKKSHRRVTRAGGRKQDRREGSSRQRNVRRVRHHRIVPETTKNTPASPAMPITVSPASPENR